MWIGLRAWFMLEGRDLFRALGTSTFRLDAPRLCFRVSPTDELHGFHGGQRVASGKVVYGSGDRVAADVATVTA